MDFFEHQADARRRIWLLAGYFLLAMSIIIGAFNGEIYFILWWQSKAPYPLTRWIDHPACWWITGIAAVVMVGGSARKRWQLRDGGVALAHLVDATEVPPDTALTDEHQVRIPRQSRGAFCCEPLKAAWTEPLRGSLSP